MDFYTPPREHVPAVNYDRAGLFDFVLLGIDHVEEVENTAWVCGHAVVRPGQEVELVDTPRVLRLCESIKFSQLTTKFLSICKHFQWKEKILIKHFL